MLRQAGYLGALARPVCRAAATSASAQHANKQQTQVVMQQQALSSTPPPKQDEVFASLSPDVLRQGPEAAYAALVQQRLVREDAKQLAAVAELQRVWRDVHAFQAPVRTASADQTDDGSASIASPAGMLARFRLWGSRMLGDDETGPRMRDVLSSSQEAEAELERVPDVPTGVYLYGGVGTGKSFLMDLFHACCQDIPRRRRVHFHAFMLDVHARLHEMRQQLGGGPDAVVPLAQQLVNEAWLICFDEFQVTDVADAMIIRRLFSHMFANGAVMVATSNRAVRDLYKHGLQYRLFEPFKADLTRACVIHDIDSAVDYRHRGRILSNCFLVNPKPDAMQQVFRVITDGAPAAPMQLSVLGHSLEVPMAANGVALFRFDALCKNALGAIDYIALSSVFHTLLLDQVPKLSVSHRAEARRLITLIDEVYNRKVRLIVASAVPIAQLFDAEPGDDDAAREDAIRQHRLMMDDLGLRADSDELKSSIFSGEDEIFAFQRALSRLREMQTAEYHEVSGEQRSASYNDTSYIVKA